MLHQRSNDFNGRGVNLAVISIVFTTAAAALVGTRVASRMSTGRKLGSDDYAIVLSMIFSVGLTICNCISVDHGSGKVSTTLTPEDLRIALQTFWAAQILYKFTINLTKTSICLLYLRIFPSINFRRTVYVVLAYILLYAFASIIATIVQCAPVARIWDHNVDGTCINLTAFWYANAAANIIGDFLILGLPMPVIRSLHLPQRQRCGLILVFALGGFVCITSILRMTTLKTGSKATDQTYGTLNSTIWTTIEANTGIICACLPMLKGPLAALFPGLFPRGSSGSNEYSGGSASYRRRAAHSGPRNSPAHTYGGWGRLESNRQGVTNTTSSSAEKATPSKVSHDNSSDDIFVTPSQDIPLGHITKTTRLDVQYGTENTKPGSQKSKKNSQDHMRSLSEAHLVGKDFVFQ